MAPWIHARMPAHMWTRMPTHMSTHMPAHASTRVSVHSSMPRVDARVDTHCSMHVVAHVPTHMSAHRWPPAATGRLRPRDMGRSVFTGPQGAQVGSIKKNIVISAMLYWDRHCEFF